jgi:flagellar protein FlbT
MYLARNPKVYHEKYFDMIREIQTAAPSTALRFMAINDRILDGSYYKALKEAKDLIKYEQDLISNAK